MHRRAWDLHGVKDGVLAEATLALTISAGDTQIDDFVIDYPLLFARPTHRAPVFRNTTTTLGGTTQFLGIDVSLANHTCVAVRI